MIQVVAYNQSDETPTFLDIQEAPGISVNYSFADIRNPEQRNSSYSHTFKVPFTQTNNQFFENCFEVNLTTSTFNPQKRTNATIYVDSIPQLQGVLQVKNIYQKAKLYEVVIFGEGADLFSQIKDKKLIDAFRDVSDGVTLDTQWNHLLNYSNVTGSWTGGLTNTAGETKSDILYPIIDYAKITSSDDQPITYHATQTGLGINTSLELLKDLMISPTHLKPAIKLKTIFQQIIAKAGFSYTSSFIDGSYFGKLWFLLGTENEELFTDPIGGLKVGISADVPLAANTTTYIQFNDEDAADGYYDVDENWTSSTGYTVVVPGNYKFGYKIKIYSPHSEGSTTNYDEIYVKARIYKNGQQQEYNNHSCDAGGVSPNPSTNSWTSEFDGIDCSAGDVITFKVGNYSESSSVKVAVTLKTDSYFELLGTNTGKENMTVFIPDNCPDITQADFLKDLIQRFNLVVVPNPEQESHLKIEPFNDYLDAGVSKDWEGKLDLSKEVLVRFNNELMNQKIEFKDLEDDDQTNFYHQKTFGEVYGQFTQDNKDKELAKDTPLENNSIYSPFIATTLPNEESLDVNFQKFLIHRSYSLEGGDVSRITTKPKLFYYGGSTYSLGTNFYMWDGVAETVRTLTSYPYCSNFDSNPVTSSTKDLRWGGGYPYSFDSELIGSAYTNNNLFNVYWARYINEIYSEDARIMTAHIYLNEQDILNFNFNDKIFINNCFWRINKIDGYQVGEKAPTKVELIKIITKTAHNCNIEPGTFNANGSVSFISTVDGSSADATQECCEQWGFTWSPLRLNKCRWKPLGNLPPDKVPISNGGKIFNNNNLTIGSGSNGMTYKQGDSLAIATKNVTNNVKSGTQIVTFTGKTDTADVTEVFMQGITNNRFEVPVNTYCTLEATLNSVQTGLDNNNGTIGSSSYAVYKCGVKNVNNVVSLVGSATRESLIQDSDAGTRALTFDVANGSGYKGLVVKVQGNANMRILWSCDLKIDFNHFEISNEDAIWQDDNNLQFQDGDDMLWN